MISDPIYKLRPIEVFTALGTSPSGISSGEVSARQKLYGNNLLTVEAGEEKAVAEIGKHFLQHVSHPLAVVLWVSGGIAFIVREPILGLVIWLLVLVNAAFSIWREHRAEAAMQALRNLLPPFARLIRDGVEASLPASEIVPGDLLVLAEGDHIPADARVVEAFGLRLNNATLTGEAMPARKTADASFREGISEIERPNLVFAGTSIVSGTGKAVVFATGMSTQFGRIARLTQAVQEPPSPLQVELGQLTRRISLVALGISAVVFIVGAFDVGLERFDAFLLALGILAAALPEGLPANITLSLAIAGQRLAARGVLVKKLAVIETLGTVSTICTDKSGTLTQNQMTVRETWLPGQRFSFSGVGYEPKGVIHPAPENTPRGSDLSLLLGVGVLSNNSRLSAPTAEKPYWSSLGDQTEAALRVAALKNGIKDDDLTLLLPRLHELPFEANRKRMSTIHRLTRADGFPQALRKRIPDWLVAFLEHNHPAKGHQAGKQAHGAPDSCELALVKGAPREVLQLCEHVFLQGEAHPLEAAQRLEILAAIDEYASQALRVLALAYRVLPARSGSYSVEGVEHDLTFLGLVAMHDPPRPEVAEAVKICRQAGIRWVMVTGDYGLTAESLARRVGMLATPDPLIVNGVELDELDDEGLQSLLEKEAVFARMAPEHKLRLVSALQARGDVVAVTGDGVNDAPALRKADIGVCMGLTGTDVAKEAADVVLTNDNFAAIVSAIEEGRAVFDNVRKFTTYIFSSNVPEILPFMLTALWNIPLALTVRQILAIDLGTDLLPGLALGAERPEPDVMRRPPRRRDRPLIDARLLRRAFLWLGLIEALLCYAGFTLIQALAGRLDAFPLFIQLRALAVQFIPALANISALPPAQVDTLAATVFHAGVVMAQVGNAFACRTETNRGRTLGWISNPLLWLGVFVEIALIVILIYSPPLARAFNHLPLPGPIWVWLAAYVPFLYGLEWVRKGIIRRFRKLPNMNVAS